MRKRQTDEETQVWFYVAHHNWIGREPGIEAREWVGCIHMRCAAEGVARILVKQNEKRQKPIRRCLPLLELTGCCRDVRLEEALSSPRALA